MGFCTGLMTCSRTLSIACVSLYLQFGWTGVHFAAYGGHIQTVKHLVEVCGCQPDKKDKVRTALCCRHIDWSLLQQGDRISGSVGCF